MSGNGMEFSIQWLETIMHFQPFLGHQRMSIGPKYDLKTHQISAYTKSKIDSEISFPDNGL